MVNYFVTSVPNASWEKLAGALCYYGEENAQAKIYPVATIKICLELQKWVKVVIKISSSYFFF